VRRGGRGAGVLFSLTVSASCLFSSAPPVSSPLTASTAASDAVVGAARFLSRVSAYDYALAGSFAGERARVVSVDRYVDVLAADREAVFALKDQVVAAAFADPTLAKALIAAADELVAIEEDLQAVDVDDPAAFARVLDHVDAAWKAFASINALRPSDPLAAAIARGAAWRVTVSRSPVFAVQTAPYASHAEADEAARRIGSVELVADTAPFTIRVVTTPDRGSAVKRVDELRAAGVLAAVVDTDRYAFARSGPDPAAELWREGAVDIPTWAQARRAAFVANGVVIASADGETFAFTDTGKLWWHAKLRPGPSFATPSADGRYVLVGGQSFQLLGSAGEVIGPLTRLPSSAAGAVWLPRAKLFVAASQGPTGKPPGGGGAVIAVRLDGAALGDPFPLVTPAAGPALAATPALDAVFVATTSNGTTDVESIRPGVDERVRTVLRVEGQVSDLVIDDEGRYAVLVTASGTYRFQPTSTNAAATLERIGGAARDVAFGHDGMLYAAFENRLVAYDRALRSVWSVPLRDGRRVVVARRIVTQDGISRALAVDPATGAVDELAPIGELNDIAVSADGARVLLLGDGQRAVIFQLP
jgi:hypothetical protein